MPHLTAIVTIAAILFYVFVGLQVASAHQKFGVKLPATTGHPDFERMFRIQMNMLEWMPVFLPLLWLCALYLSDMGVWQRIGFPGPSSQSGGYPDFDQPQG